MCASRDGSIISYAGCVASTVYVYSAYLDIQKTKAN
jgi:hypothetical protein